MKFQCTFRKSSPYYAIHLPWSHVHCQPSLKPCFCPIGTIAPRYQAPCPLPIWIPSPSHHVSCWAWWYYHPWTPPRGFPRLLTLPKDIQCPPCFCIWFISPYSQWQTCHSLRRRMYFWRCRRLVSQNTTKGFKTRGLQLLYLPMFIQVLKIFG